MAANSLRPQFLVVDISWHPFDRFALIEILTFCSMAGQDENNDP